MERNFGAEIDGLKTEIMEIKSIIKSLAEKADQNVSTSALSKNVNMVDKTKPLKKIHPMRNMHPDERLSEKMEELCVLTDERDITGLVTYMGVFASGGRQSNWIRNEVNTDDLLELIENNIVTKVLNCLGNRDRLNILLAILKKPRSVAELVQECALNSTGQAYHHMKPLLAADLITEDTNNSNKGIYIVQPHKVRGIIMLLAGICDMVDETFTKGNWEE
ncbi:MAG: winged helix-turn-helix transcriptional regulator [Lachnospiraceae bacterium]|nr:winged helix-turn-helix transcriptional regulator [Lachnospiraceae bacterium]